MIGVGDVVKCLKGATEYSKPSGIPLVVSHFCHYLSLLTFTTSTAVFLKNILLCAHSALSEACARHIVE